MKEDEVKKLKEELQEESNPRRVEKIKYLIQRMVIHLRIIHEKFTFKILVFSIFNLRKIKLDQKRCGRWKRKNRTKRNRSPLMH
jgi:hypothetical protein